MKKNKYKIPPLLCWDIYIQGIQRFTQWRELPIGGFQKQSLIDFPGNISSVIFTQGCNLRCVYCHNPDLVFPERFKKLKIFDPVNIIKWIDENKKLLDAVVITGGEPTMHNSLPDFIKRIKNMRLKIKLDTNGTNPEMLKTLIANKQIDYLAMDVKAPLLTKKYRKIAGNGFGTELMEKILHSIKIIKSGNVNFEFRITVFDKYHTEQSINEIASCLSGKLFIQNFRNSSGIIQQGLKPFPNIDCMHETMIKSTRLIVRS